MIKVKIETSPKEVEFGLLKACDVFIYQKKTFMRVLNAGTNVICLEDGVPGHIDVKTKVIKPKSAKLKLKL